MNTNDRNSQKRNIMDYLPQHERAKVRKLVERLAEQAQQKQKFKKLYEQLSQKYQQLNKKCEELQQQNDQLRSQMMTSRLAINKAKAAYVACKSAKKITKGQQQLNTKSQQMHIENTSLKQTWLKIPKSQVKKQTKLNNSTINNYIFQQSQNNQNQINFNSKTQRLEQPSLKKQQYSSFYDVNKKEPSVQRKSQRVFSSSKKKEQILTLKKQIQSLTQEMKKKQNSNLELDQKFRRCQQIKNRYKISKNVANNSNCKSDQDGQIKQQVKGKDKLIASKRNLQAQNSNDKVTLRAKGKISRLNNQQNTQSDQSDQDQMKNNKNKKARVNEQHHSKNNMRMSSQQINVMKESKSKKYNKKQQAKTQFDQDFFAIIDQLNSGN